jgi:hypothetical protein
MSVDLMCDEPGFVDVAQLRLEAGWLEVGRGLTKILVGCLLLIGGPVVAVSLCVLLVVSLPGKPITKANLLAFEAVFWLGVAIVVLCGIFGYWKILAGVWKCLKHAPERCGARWLMFCCMTCMTMGPALNMAFGWGCVKRAPTFQRGPDGLKLLQLDESFRVKQVACITIFLTSLALFILFLRSVARCFGDTGRVTHVTVYWIVWGLFLGWAGYVFVLNPDELLKLETWVLLGAGFAISFLWCLYLVLSIRLCISSGMQYMRSPLEM